MVKEHVQRWRNNHCLALESLRAESCKLSGFELWQKLKRIERDAAAIGLRMCNGPEYTEEELDKANAAVTARIEKLFGKLPEGFFINHDPRGYALKLDNDAVTIPEGMHRDWGGYGILAAIIN